MINSSQIPDGTNYVGLEHIDGTSGIAKAVKVTSGELASSKFAFRRTQILYGKLRPYLAKIACPDFDGICSTDILPIEPGPDVDRRFLFWFLRQPTMIEYASLRAAGANLPRLSPDTLANFPVPLPRLDVQRRIADTLDRADALRRKRRKALAELEELPQAIFHKMFPRSGHMERALSELVAPNTIVTYGIVQAGEEFPGGVPYIRTGDIVDGVIVTEQLRHADPAIAARFQRSRVNTGDIVMSIRATVGTTAVVPPELDGANLTQGTAKIAPGPLVDRHYLLAVIRSHSAQQWIAKQTKGATFREITLGRLRELPILVPPIALQREFGASIEVIDRLKAQYKAHLEKLEELFASLQYRAFRDEL
ncbi:restriction endonuclease subunit S [Corallococcus exiguus]|uniref:restriction endonuclease subunit S n=1 Tax=Corallococcus exiguus TaxID=83462 RepID=UPI0015600B24|nr:restriction endonuclease subunit S [Corallococcus exiguus]